MRGIENHDYTSLSKVKEYKSHREKALGSKMDQKSIQFLLHKIWELLVKTQIPLSLKIMVKILLISKIKLKKTKNPKIWKQQKIFSKKFYKKTNSVQLWLLIDLKKCWKIIKVNIEKHNVRRIKKTS